MPPEVVQETESDLNGLAPKGFSLVVTSATLVVTGALLVVTRS